MIRRFIVLSVSVATLAASPPSHASEWSDLLDTWNGQNWRALRDVWGQPSSYPRNPIGHMIYVYEKDRGSVSLRAFPQAKTKVGRSCRVYFQVDDGEIIKTWSEGKHKTCWKHHKKKTVPAEPSSNSGS